MDCTFGSERHCMNPSPGETRAPRRCWGGGSNGAFSFPAATISRGPQISVSDSITVKYGLCFCS